MENEISIQQSREQRAAKSRIDGFIKKFGGEHLLLASHAAFPLVLTPDLLYQIWANFVPDAPWESVAQILLSRLCRQVDYEMYEMDITVRSQLIRQLKNETGQKRLNDLAEFLMEYIQIRQRDADPGIQEIMESQRWTALAYTKPDEATHEITQALYSKVKQNDRAGILQLTALLKQIADPLSEYGFSPLLTYARGVESFARGELEESVSELQPLWRNNLANVAGVELPIPQGLEEYLLPETEQLGTETKSSVQSLQELCGSLYVIGIGGTGAKCLESITHLTSTGLVRDIVPTGVNALFIDADETNRNLERARNSIRIYQKIYALFAENRQLSPFMDREIASLDVWSPFRDFSTNKQLSTLFNYNSLKQNNPTLGHLFDVLYTQEEREASLDVGFRGRPAVGAAAMSQVDLNLLEEEPWNTLFERIRRDAGSGVSPSSIVLYGSIFGGTGASGLSTIGRLIANKLENENLRNSVRIAGVFLLPYFSFSPPVDAEQVYACSDQFMLNTEAALRYYMIQAQQTFDTVYLLGSKALSKVDFSIGKQSQRNKPHFLEVYAGLATRHFIKEKPAKGSVVLVNRYTKDVVSWSDLPEHIQVKQYLSASTYFAYTWLSYIVPQLANAKSRGPDIALIPWFRHFYTSKSRNFFGYLKSELPNLQSDSKQQQAIDGISEWCRDHLRWMTDLHDCEGETIQLFNSKVIQRLSPGRDELSILSNNPQPNQVRGFDELRMRLDSPNTLGKGTIGLARTVYQLFQMSS